MTYNMIKIQIVFIELCILVKSITLLGTMITNSNVE
jgi:hypothetical protein